MLLEATGYSLELFPFLKQNMTSNTSILAYKITLYTFVLIWNLLYHIKEGTFSKVY